MTIDRLYEIADETDDGSYDIPKVCEGLPKTNRADLTAFLLLDKIFPGLTDIVAAAEHDQIYLGIPLDDFAKLVTEDQARVLFHYFGLFIDEDSLAMFV